MSSNHTAADDTIDLGEVLGTLRRGLRWIVGGTVLGIGAAAAVLWLVPPRYETTATVLVRESAANSGSALSQLAGLAEMMPGLGGLGAIASSLDTELEILTSRAVIGEVVDTLGLQVQVAEPRGVAPRELFASTRIDAQLPEPTKYRFTRAGDAYRVEGPRGVEEVRPGVPHRLVGGEVTLRSEGLPESFEVTLVDREDAISLVEEELESEEVAGQVVELVYEAADPNTAAEVPNLIVDKYLTRRRTVDRGTNQRRYEFLTEQTDSISKELIAAETALRLEQERTGMLDPQLTGELGLERVMELQGQLELADVEARALEQVMAQRAQRDGSPRELAAYPTFMENPAINVLLEQLYRLETDRVALLQSRTEQDPDVVALTEAVDNLESQLVGLSRDYLNGLSRQRSELRSELDGYSGLIAQFPEQAMQSLRRQREVRRLSETLVVLQTQLVTARLGAIGEGGDVRQIDAATPPRRASFPSLPIFLAVGLVGGLVMGTAGALGSEYLGSAVRRPQHAELATGLPAIKLQPGAPLLLGGVEELRTVLVIPVGRGARAGEVAHSLARAAALRGAMVTLVDVERAAPLLPRRPALPGLPAPLEQAKGTAVAPLRESHDGDAFAVVRAEKGEALDPAEVRETLGRLEERLHTVIAAVAGVESPLTMALLVGNRPVVIAARAGSATRAELRDAVETLRRAGMMVSGVVLHNGDGSGHSGA